MVHSGYEASANNYCFGSIRGFVAMAKATLFPRYPDEEAKALLNEPVRPIHSYKPLVQIKSAEEVQA
jgi:hypothetical protein